MCIIVAKGKGINMPSKEILKNCFDYNSDGAGYMFVRDGKVYINKGFMTFDKFYESIDKLSRIIDLTEHALVMHFRISTGGNVDAGNCHPYPITSNEEHLRRTQFVTDLGMAHNGTISTYSTKYGYGYTGQKEILNDTQKFIRDCVSTIKELDNDFLKNQRAMKLIEDIAGSKLCFLDTDENIHLVGDFIEDNGVFYSNSNYLSHRTYPRPSYYDGYGYGNGKGRNYTAWDDYDYYTPIDIPEYLSENMLLEGQDEPLEKEVFDLLMVELEPLHIGDTVEFDDTEYTVPDKDKYYVDSFWNLYFVDKEKMVIGLIAKDVFPM